MGYVMASSTIDISMRRVIVLAVCILLRTVVLGQVRNIVIDSVYNCNEPTIAIDPRNPLNIVAGSNTSNYYLSTDGGNTWTNGNLASTYGVDGDPVVIVDTTGALYYVHLAINPSLGFPESLDRIVCQSMDNIASGTWTDGSFAGHISVPATDDKPGVGIDRTTNTLYLCWTKFDQYQDTLSTDSSNIYFSKSTDQGNTWSTAVRINQVAGDCSDSDPTVEGAIPCVGPNGEVYVGWASYDAIVFDRSFDQGNTWVTNDVHVADVPGGWNFDVPGLWRCNGLPFTACDVSTGPYRGAIYINWTDQRNGANNTDVWISKSNDSGATWSAPLKVNDDTGSSQQFMSSMTVDPATGFIYIVFYDRRNYMGYPTADSNLTDVYLAVSKDGAATFQNYLISTSPFNPVRTSFMGDYTFISAFNNVVRPIWTRLNITDTLSNEEIVTAIVDSTIGGESIPTVIAGNGSLQVYPNPTANRTTISFEVPAGGPASIYVTDISGSKIATLAGNTFYAAGTHNIPFNTLESGLSSGLYFLTLRCGSYAATRKLVVTR